MITFYVVSIYEYSSNSSQTLAAESLSNISSRHTEPCYVARCPKECGTEAILRNIGVHSRLRPGTCRVQALPGDPNPPATNRLGSYTASAPPVNGCRCGAWSFRLFPLSNARRCGECGLDIQTTG